MTGKRKLYITVISDLACPWCYVGKKRLDKAMARFSDTVEFEVEWRCYVIDPRTKLTGEKYLAYCTRRWGSDAWTASLRTSGRPDGAAFADWQWWPNTLHAHRLVHLATQQQLGSAMADALFEEQYERGGNISLVDTLVAVAARVGVVGAAEYLDGEEGLEEVLAEDQHAKQECVVPC